VVENEVNLSTFANIFVAITTGILAFFTYQSVKVSESNIEIANRALALQQLSFTKEQIIDQINNFFIPLDIAIEKEIFCLSKMQIGYRIFEINSFYSFNKSAYLDFGESIFFDEINADSTQNPITLNLKTDFPIFFELLIQRQKLLQDCKMEIQNFISIYHSYHQQITDYIEKNYPIEQLPYENGDQTIDIDFIMLDEDLPMDESYNYHHVNLMFPEFSKILQSTLILDIFTSMETINPKSSADLKKIYSQNKDELRKIFNSNEIEYFYKQIKKNSEGLVNIDKKIMGSSNQIKTDYIVQYKLKTKDLQKKEN
jgi:hypothetical protein